MPPEGNDVEVEGTETPPEPQFVRREDFDTLAGLVRGMQETMSTGFNALAAQRQTQGQPREEAVEDASDDEIEAALNSGTGADKFRKLVRAAEARANKRIDALQSEGLGAIANVVKQTAVAALPHYTKYKKEIDEYVDQLPANQRMNPEVYAIAHRIVIGGHHDELVAEAIENMKRGGTEPKVNTPGTGGNRGGSTRSMGAGASSDPDSEQLDALAGSGRTADGFAQRLGYQSWADYMQRTNVETA